MFNRTGRPGSVVAVIVAGLAGPAAAESSEAVAAVRGGRPVSIGLSPGGPLADLRYPAIPLPALRLGVSLSPRLTVDLTGGMSSSIPSIWAWSISARVCSSPRNVSP